MKDKTQEFAKKIKISFNDIDLLKQAFVHKSFLNENQNFKLKNNERLEFLGDAVLELITTDFLFRQFPEKPEGDLTNIRASLVNSNTLSDVAQNLEIDKYLFLSRGESKDKNSKARRYIMADSVEAIIGAIYIDKNYDEAKKFVEKNILYKIDEILEKELYMDPKTKFQEKAQEQYNITPKYKLIGEKGPDHNKIFTVGLYIDEKLISKAEGSSKQEAEINAAILGLKKQNW
ncbi:MAG: ribonuclease III [Patescibacteria group bacterium]|nr:ribonuclease III [Patescibacteria group bacterium]MDD4303933.1 ribonuclease III [Patescibacteria group bacterium]MDD4695079.1 ribonuclease III [Patescibacteria group bacterium]